MIFASRSPELRIRTAQTQPPQPEKPQNIYPTPKKPYVLIVCEVPQYDFRQEVLRKVGPLGLK